MKVPVTQLSVTSLFWMLTMTFFFNKVFAQTNPVSSVNITLPANPDANTANWGTGSSVFAINASSQSANGRINPALEESRILVIIKKGGAKICGKYTANTAPAANFSTMTKVWSGSNASALLASDCTLPPGDYELSVRFFGYSNGKDIPLSEEKVKPFTIKGNEQQAYQAPQLIGPANNTILTEDDIKKPVAFRWTPIVPRPQEPTTYRLKVWQLMQGQNGAQAVRANQPVITKDVDNITQAIISNLITGPCKPPYLCEFVWSVQALSRDGKPIGSNNGTSEVYAFRKGGEFVPFDTLDARFRKGGNVVIHDTTEMALRKNQYDPHDTTYTEFRKGGNVVIHDTTEMALRKNQYDPHDTTYAEFKKGRVAGADPKPPDNAIRTNKPFFEKDSLNTLGATATGSKPLANADIIRRPTFLRDRINELSATASGSKPTNNGFRTNKPFFEKDSLNELTTSNTGSTQFFTLSDGITISNYETQGGTGSPKYSGQEITVAGALFLQIDSRYFKDASQISYSIKNITTNKVSPTYTIGLKKVSQPAALVLPLQNPGFKSGETGTITINALKKYYYISFKRN